MTPNRGGREMSFLDRIRRRLVRVAGGESDGMIPCEEALRFVHEYLDGELDGESLDRVKTHFDACARCYPQLRLEESFRTAIRHALSREGTPEGLREQILELLPAPGE
jgi:mycothiol system anti-sigma-R factor